MIRLPFVARSTLDMMERRRVDLAEAHQRELEVLDAAHQRLLDSERTMATAQVQDIVRRYEQDLADLRSALTLEQTRVSALTQSLIEALKPPPLPGLQDRQPRKVSPVQQAIRDEAGSDTRLAAYLRKRADDLRREGKKDEEIVELLHTWETADSFDPSLQPA